METCYDNTNMYIVISHYYYHYTHLNLVHMVECFDTVTLQDLGHQKECPASKILSDQLLAWLSVWSEVQMICIRCS